MVAAFHMAGFNVWDVNMQDLCTGQLTLDRFRGVAFVGGFSYADVSGSAKGKVKDLRRQFRFTLSFNQSPQIFNYIHILLYVKLTSLTDALNKLII